MSTAKRHQYILDKIKKEGHILVSDISKELSVSEVTIRKDLRGLEDKGLLFRNHGGASWENPYVSDKPLSHKQQINTLEKSKIAKKAVSFIEENDVIILGSGTTVLSMVENLPVDKNLTVITSSLIVSSLLCKYENIAVIQLGGDVRRSSQSTVGPISQHQLRLLSANKLFIGIDGLDVEFGISTSNTGEAYLNQQMIECSRKVYILSDHSKFGKRGLGKVCDLKEIDFLITDQKLNGDILKKLNEYGVQVVVSD